nr:hypothetical protein BaRGS_024726 [Batillaria attramentaria]
MRWPDCSKPCPFFTYGPLCNGTCRACLPLNGTACHPVTGKCLHGCLPGLMGTECNQSCPLGHYGLNCSVICGMCRYGLTTCDPVTGRCRGGCFPGYMTSRCNVIYHKDVEERPEECRHCSGGRDNCLNGTFECLKGCIEGWVGKGCTLYDWRSEQSRFNKAPPHDKYQETMLVGLVAGFFTFMGMIVVVNYRGHCARRRDDFDVSAENCGHGQPGNRSSLYEGPVRPVTEYYFQVKVLASTDSIENLGEVRWHLTLCSLLGWTFVFLTLFKGIQSLSKVVYFTSITPYILLTTLLVHELTMPGAADGLLYFITPDFSRLLDFKIWSDAAVQIFFSLSTAEGGLIALASYNKFHNNIIRDAILVPIINSLTSIFAGFVVFAALGHLATLQHVAVEHIVDSGLAFIAYPSALSMMSLPAFWSALFFLLFVLLGLSSQFSLVQMLNTVALDEFPALMATSTRRLLCCLAICFSGFILGLPFLTQGGHSLLDLVDASIVGIPLLVVALFELIGLIHIYAWLRQNRLSSEKRIFCHCRQFQLRGYPYWAEGVYWGIVVAATIPIPVYFLYRVWPRTWPLRNGFCQHIKSCMQSQPEYQQKRLEQFMIGPCPLPLQECNSAHNTVSAGSQQREQPTDNAVDEDDIYVNNFSSLSAGALL